MSRVTSYRLVVAMVAAVLVMAASAQAQQPGGRFGNRGGGRGFQPVPGMDKLQLLTNEAVQKDLELADDQKADLKKVAENAAEQARGLFSFEGFRELSEAEREKRLAENQQKREKLGKEVIQKVEAVLLPHQLDRLGEISIQVRGTRALDDPEVAKALGITEQQKEKLTAVREEMGTKMREAFQGGGGQEGARERFAALRKESEEKTLAVLTAAQKDQFAKMKGEPFDVEAANLRFGGGGGFGFGGGQPGQGRPGQGGRPGGQGNQPRTRPGSNPNNN